MTSKEIIKRLIAEGWFLAGGKGDHEKFKHPLRPGRVVVPHPRKDVAIGTLLNINRQAGSTAKRAGIGRSNSHAVPHLCSSG